MEQVNEHERQLALAGDRIGAIKAYRLRIGCLLSDAKRAIDAAVPPRTESRTYLPFKQIRAELWARVYANELARALRLDRMSPTSLAREMATQAVEDFDAYLERSKP